MHRLGFDVEIIRDLLNNSEGARRRAATGAGRSILRYLATLPVLPAAPSPVILCVRDSYRYGTGAQKKRADPARDRPIES